VTIVENDLESKGNNDKERDKDSIPLSEEDSNSKSNGVGMTTITALTQSSQLQHDWGSSGFIVM
jgi:hypothetical protein